MAKKHRKSHTPKRRRSGRKGIGAINMSNVLTKVAGIAAGAVAARMANNSIGDKVSPKLAAAGTIAVGVMLPKFLKSELGEAVGEGFIAVGAVGLLQNFGVLKGIEDGIAGADELEIAMSGIEQGFAGVDEIGAFEEMEP
jgi:hypothetical protein